MPEFDLTVTVYLFRLLFLFGSEEGMTSRFKSTVMQII